MALKKIIRNNDKKAFEDYWGVKDFFLSISINQFTILNKFYVNSLFYFIINIIHDISDISRIRICYCLLITEIIANEF